MGEGATVTGQWERELKSLASGRGSYSHWPVGEGEGATVTGCGRGSYSHWPVGEGEGATVTGQWLVVLKLTHENNLANDLKPGNIQH